MNTIKMNFAPLRYEEGDSPLKPGRIGITAVYLCCAAILLRTFDIETNQAIFVKILSGEVVFITLYTLYLWKYKLPTWMAHIYFAIQSGLTFGILSLWPDFDFITFYFVLLSYQVSLVFSGKTRWVWVGILASLMSISLMIYHGIFHGLALSLTNVAACIVIPAYIIVNHEIELARQHSQRLLVELESTNEDLKAYTRQVDELASIQERNRLARELHDTVSQSIFSISLMTRSAQLMLEKDSSHLPEQLNHLQLITNNALAQLRSLITQLRPSRES